MREKMKREGREKDKSVAFFFLLSIFTDSYIFCPINLNINKVFKTQFGSLVVWPVLEFRIDKCRTGHANWFIVHYQKVRLGSLCIIYNSCGLIAGWGGIIILFFRKKKSYLIHPLLQCDIYFILFIKKIELNVLKKWMFYFNHLKKLVLRVILNLMLSKVLYLKFVNKKII